MEYTRIQPARSEDEIQHGFEMAAPRSVYSRQSSMGISSTPYIGHDAHSDTEPLWEVNQHEPRPFAKPLSNLKTLIVQLFALLWLIPIVALLYLNIRRHVIGASAWCPFNKCYTQTWASDGGAPAVPAEFDKQTHNLFGFLQIVSKLLEIWFIMISTWLVYLITMYLAGRAEGIPIGYLTRPSEFAELPGLFDTLLWKTVRRLPSTQNRARRRLWLFLIATIALCVVCNLIGPAVAVLLLPSLQWIDLKHADQERFLKMNSNSPLSTSGASYPASFSFWCTEDEINAQKYSCNRDGAATVDAWIEASMSSQNTYEWMSIQDGITFTYNGTEYSHYGRSELTEWAPSRQVLEKLNTDLWIVQNISDNQQPWDANSTKLYETYNLFNSTVQSIVQRNAPILGAIVNTWADFENRDHWTTIVDDSRSIKCYRSYNISNIPLCWGGCSTNPISENYTRCISVGDGWDNGSKSANFTVYGNYYDDLQSFAPNLTVDVYTSGQVAWLDKGQLPTGVSSECITDGTVPADASCDWDTFWKSHDESTLYRSGPVTTVEISRETAPVPGYPSSGTLAIDFTAFEWFATYSLDVSLYTNRYMTATVLMNSPFYFHPIAVDPTWVAAAWVADVGGYMPSARSLTQRLEYAMDRLRDSVNSSQPLYDNNFDINPPSLMPVLQALSLIDYNTITDPINLTTTAADKNPNSKNLSPLLYRWGKINVYAYGLSTRTSYFGVVTVIVGCLVVLVEVYMGLFVDRRSFGSPTQLVIAALEHPYQDEFRGARGNEKVVWRTRFRVTEDASKVGGLAYEKML